MFSGISSFIWGEDVKSAEVKGAEAEAKPAEVMGAKAGTDQGGMGEVMNVDDLDVMSVGSDDDISLSPTRRMSEDEWEVVKLSKLKGKLQGSKAHEKRRSRRAKEVLKTPTMKDLFKPSPTVVAVPSFEKSWASIVKDNNTLPTEEVESSEPFLIDNSSLVTTSESRNDNSDSFLDDSTQNHNYLRDEDIYDYEEEYLARTLKETLISKQYNSNVPRLKSYSLRSVRRPATVKVEKHPELSYAVKASPPPTLVSEKHPNFYRNRVEGISCEENTKTVPAEENLFNMGKREARFMNYMNRKVKLDDRKRKKAKLMEDKYSRKTKPNNVPMSALTTSDIQKLIGESQALSKVYAEATAVVQGKPARKAVKQEVKKCPAKPKPSAAETERVSSRQRTTSLNDQQVEDYYFMKMKSLAQEYNAKQCDAGNERVISQQPQPAFESQHQLDSETLPHKIAGSRLNFYRRSPRLKKSLSVNEWINEESNELRVFLDIKMNPKKSEGKGVDSFFNRLTHIAMNMLREENSENERLADVLLNNLLRCDKPPQMKQMTMKPPSLNVTPLKPPRLVQTSLKPLRLQPSAAESAEEVADQLNRKAEEHYKPERRHKRDKERLALSRKHIAMSNASRSLNTKKGIRGGIKAPRARATVVREKRSGRASANKRQ